MTILPVIPTSPDQPDAVATRRRPSMPPRHLADLDLAARKAAVTTLGEPAFRAKQLSTHYFGRLVRDIEVDIDRLRGNRGPGSDQRDLDALTRSLIDARVPPEPGDEADRTGLDRRQEAADEQRQKDDRRNDDDQRCN